LTLRLSFDEAALGQKRSAGSAPAPGRSTPNRRMTSFEPKRWNNSSPIRLSMSAPAQPMSCFVQ